MKNFGEFFNDQIETAACIVFSHADVTDAEKLANAVNLVREHNANATVVTTPWNRLDGKEILSAMEHSQTLESELKKLSEEHEHHHHDEDGECCRHGHHHDEDEEHEHHHHHEEGECCHHHHHADEVFTSFGVESSKSFTESGLKGMLSSLSDADKYGVILRAKGIVPCDDGSWIHFDYIPGEIDIRKGSASYTGRLCVIGSKINEDNLKELFKV